MAISPVRLFIADNAQGVTAFQYIGGFLYGFKQITFIEVVNKHGDNLCIRFGNEGVALGVKESAKLFIIFNNAVMNNGDTAGSVRMWCELILDGSPWVAQRVCTIPKVPLQGFSLIAFAKLVRRSFSLYTLSLPFSKTATPAES